MRNVKCKYLKKNKKKNSLSNQTHIKHDVCDDEFLLFKIYNQFSIGPKHGILKNNSIS